MIKFDGQFSKNDLAATLHALGRETFFIQIGAMDGVSLDPIHAHVKELHWQGLLLEPLPDMAVKLRANYADCRGLTFIEAAIADFDGQIEMTRIDPAAVQERRLTDLALALSTLMPDRGMLGSAMRAPEFVEALEPYKRILNVPCFRLQTVLKNHAVTKLDLMVIDTEGADWMVARQLSLDEYRPRVVYLEFNHLTSYEQTACAMHFRNHGYRIYLEQPKAENFLAISP